MQPLRVKLLRAVFAVAACAAIASCGQSQPGPTTSPAPAVTTANTPGNTATGLTGDTREQFIRGAVLSCTQQGARDPRTANVPSDKLADYCSCSANELADRLSAADIDAINANPEAGRASMAPRVQAAAQACVSKLR